MASPHAQNYSPHFTGALHLVTVISNPQRFETRYRLAREAIERFEKAGAVVWVVELAYGDRGFAITDATNPRHVRLRTSHELWHKENLMNVGLAHLARQVPDWKYVALVDADVQFARHDWAVETVQMLQHYHVIQMFSQGQDLLPNCEPFPRGSGLYRGYLACYRQEVSPHWLSAYETGGRHWHPGYAWAWRRDALDAVGGLIETAILGAGDRHMAAGLVGKMRQTLHPRLHRSYGQVLMEWEQRAQHGIRRNVGVMEGLLLHHWHGAKRFRRYLDRWQILVKHQYNPASDVSRDTQGVLQLVDRREDRSNRLRDDIRAYFTMRNEDSIETDEAAVEGIGAQKEPNSHR